MSWLGALFGGGGDNTAFADIPKMQDYYENPENYSAPPVSGDRLKASYKTANTYGSDNPFKPLNWLGSATRQPDPYSQFRMFGAESDVTQAHQKELDAIDFQHKQDLEAIHHSNLTEQQKQLAALTAQNQQAAKVQEVWARMGIAPNTDAVAAANEVQRPLVPSMARAGSQAEMETNRARAGEAGIRADQIATPSGRSNLEASLTAKDASTGIENVYKSALAKRLGYFELPTGGAVFGLDRMTPGTEAVNQPKIASHIDLSTGQPVPYQPGGLQFTLDGKPFKAVPKAGGSAVTKLLAPQFDPNVMNSPAAFSVPSGDATASTGLTPSLGATGPLAQAAQWLRGTAMPAVGSVAGQAMKPVTDFPDDLYRYWWSGQPLDSSTSENRSPALPMPTGNENWMESLQQQFNAPNVRRKRLQPSF